MVEYFLYCNDDRPLDILEMTTLLQNAGWSLRVVRNWLSREGFQVINAGDLQDEDVTFGWLSEKEPTARFDTAFMAGDRKQLDDWVYRNQLGSATWDINSPLEFDTQCEFESLDDAREQMGDLYADHLAESKSMYTVLYCQQMEFAVTVMGAAAMLRNGLIEDPQMGSCIPTPTQVSELTSFLDTWPT